MTIIYSKQEQEFLQDLLGYIKATRLQNAIQRHNLKSKDSLAKWMDAFQQEILREFTYHHPSFKELTVESETKIVKVIKKRMAIFIHKHADYFL